MSNERPVGNTKAIFDEAAEIATPRERAAYLDRACGGDQDLRRRVDTLLRALDAAGGFLEGRSDASHTAGPETAAEEATTSVSGLGQPADDPTSTDEAAADETGTYGSQQATGSPSAAYSRGARIAHRPLQAPRGNRRGGHGHRLSRRAVAARQATRRAQAHPGGDGLEDRPRPLRVGAAGAGPDGAPEHRQGARCRHD